MTRTGQRLSRPLYEGLPWLYGAAGALALVASYLCPYRALGHAIGLLGLLGVVGGIVVLLRRRDYRAMRSEYGQADASFRDLDPDE